MRKKHLFSVAFFSLVSCLLLSVTSHAISATLTPQQFGAVPDDGADDSHAIQLALNALKPGDALFFPSGTYDAFTPIYVAGLSDNHISGEAGSSLNKLPGFAGEYLIQIRFSENVTIEGMTFSGLTTDPTNYQWGEQGVYLGSTEGSIVRENHFLNFGDACLRVTTSRDSPSGVHSRDALIDSNHFINCTQVTTTQTSDNHGGTENITFQWNLFEGLKGSLKICSRKPVSGAIVRNNVLLTNKANGIEVCSYSNVAIEGNYIKDTAGYAINYYESRDFSWNNHKITDNFIENSAHGLGFWAVMPNSTYGSVINTQISDNCFSTMHGGNNPSSVIRLRSNHSNYGYDRLIINNNEFHNIHGQRLLSITPNAVNVTTENNTSIGMNCVPMGIKLLSSLKNWHHSHTKALYRSLWTHFTNQ